MAVAPAQMLKAVLCGALIGAAVVPGYPALADDAQTERLQRQIDALQAQLQALQRQVAETKKAVSTRPPAAAPTEYTKAPLVKAPIPVGINLKVGGFVAAESVWRQKNEVADIGSDFNTGIPLPNSPLSHENEFRGSARQSRLSLLATGDIDPVQHLAGYFETDFLGAGITSNSRESNSYVLRLRQAYGTYDNDDWHFHFLGGQSWSLLTQDRVGIVPRMENIPLTIDAQYVVGFDWSRNWQLRFVGDWNKVAWFGVSVESPQINFFSNSVGANTIVGGAPGGSVGGSPIPPGLAINDLNVCSTSGLLNSATACSADKLPDVIEKAAFDPGWGHYEVFGLQRWFTDRVFTTAIPGGAGANKTSFGWGVGGSVLLPIVPKYLDIQATAMYGQGIGRYGAGQLPDVTIGPDGSLSPITVSHILLGAVGHPWEGLDVYAYAGQELASRNSSVVRGTATGYGNPLFSDAGCFFENPVSGPAPANDPFAGTACTANTRRLQELTVGFWQNVYKGDLGRATVGAQYEYIKRDTFAALLIPGTTITTSGPDPFEQILMTSFRYYPFQ
jgi:hypothetical protein